MLVVVLLAAAVLSKEYRKSKSTTSKSKSLQKPQKSLSLNKDRKFGTWTPESFQLPVPEPFPNWDIKSTSPLPYRAFKHKYNITMGIRNMDWNSWFELDNEWTKFHEEKLKRVKQYDKKLHETGVEAVDAAYELLDEMRNYLPARYPTLFQKTNLGVKNLETGEDHKFRGSYRVYKGPGSEGEDPMLIAAKMVQDDLAVMMESDNGEYILKAGAVILPGFWKLEDKYNQTLENIHTHGDVPKFKEKLQSPMEKFFIRLTCDKAVVRNNYFLQTDEELGWSSSIGDEFGEKVGWYTADEANDISKIHLRSERQSLRRLPKSGAIVFTVRTYFIPISKLVEEPYIPRRLLNGIQSWEEDVQEYRGYTKFKDILLPYLEQKAEAQEKLGYLPEKETNAFPF
ncbi:hypothetical protein CANTEDRAFT_113990 [Yamadazyma tenuis ATCC 10573]|nr:uncharacterized protein CANTEDRAFT_113990 [Yamadazyma tenuis ATCC 10573]EGV63958.1 hypothetical protein CANTEDRAFT_113990 [Yamadazyma tenuis ATCC 10573]